VITVSEIRTYCLGKPGRIVEDFPFDEETLVIKVHGKMFLLTSLTDQPPALNLKCDPELALDLRARYDAVLPGYHMNKKHWNTVTLDGSVPVKELLGMIDHSYEQVVRGLPVRVRRRLETGAGEKPASNNKKGRTRRPSTKHQH